MIITKIIGPRIIILVGYKIDVWRPARESNVDKMVAIEKIIIFVLNE